MVEVCVQSEWWGSGSIALAVGGRRRKKSIDTEERGDKDTEQRTKTTHESSQLFAWEREKKKKLDSEGKV